MAFVESNADRSPQSAIQIAANEESWSRVDVQPRCRSILNAEERVRLESFAFQYATCPESYDIVISNGPYLETGVISVLPHGRFWHASGSLMAPVELKPEMVRWLKRVSDSQGKTLAVYSVGADEAPLFVDAGFEVSKFGEEPLLDLGAITWGGKGFEWVRRQTNFCRRAGLEVVEVSNESD
jgi:phosphatidylglycerol lysyltransferase